MSKFSEVHRLAAAAKLRRHVRGCEICRLAPWACGFRGYLEAERKRIDELWAKSKANQASLTAASDQEPGVSLADSAR